MAAQGGVALQEKVRKLVSRLDGKPVLKPNRPLVLKDSVANRKLQKGEASCVSEMSVLMACWKEKNFVDSLCSEQTRSFYSCMKAAQAAKRSVDVKSSSSSSSRGHLPPKQANALLKRYPNLRTEI